MLNELNRKKKLSKIIILNRLCMKIVVSLLYNNPSKKLKHKSSEKNRRRLGWLH